MKVRGSTMAFVATTAAIAVFAWQIWSGSDSPATVRVPLERPHPGNSSPTAEPDLAPIERIPVVTTRSADAVQSIVEDLGPLWESDFGPERDRGTAGLRVRVLDGDGRPLEAISVEIPPVRADVVAVHGGYGVSRPVVAHPESDEIFAGRPAGQGLDPGPHDVRVSVPGFGLGTTRVIVAAHQESTAEVRLPGRVRIIWLNIMDERGRSVPYVTSYPTFEAASVAPIPAPEVPRSVLRSPPGLDQSAISGVPGRSVDGTRRSAPRILATDSGRVAVRVIAGVRGTIVFSPGPGLFKNGKVIRITDTFDGPEWENYPITVSLGDDYDGIVAGGRRDDRDPGNRKLASTPVPRRAPQLPPSARASLTHAVLGVDAPSLPVRELRWRPLFGNAPAGTAMGFESTDDGRFETLLPDGFFGDIEISGHDGAFYDFKTSLSIRGRRWYGFALPPPDYPTSLDITGTPTLNGLIQGVAAALDFQSPRQSRHVRTAERQGDSYRLSTALNADARERLREPTVLSLSLTSSNRPDGLPLTLAMPLSDRDRDDLVSGHLSIHLPDAMMSLGQRPTIVFRAVGDRGEGLPWVAGSIVPAGEIREAEEIRGISRALGEDRFHPGAHRLVLGEMPEASLPVDAEGIVPGGLGPRPTEAKFRAALGDRAVDAYGAQNLERLWLQGAWYDTHRTVKSDDWGYVIRTNLRLTPGRVYAVYLWSKSRDDLEPDGRFLFVATPGVTDLGVLRLPSY